MLRFLFAISVFLLTFVSSSAQNLNDVRAQGKEMLRAIKKRIEKNYWDPSYGGADIQALFAKAEAAMDQAQSAGHSFGIIAQALASLKDSHTFFMPPARVARVQYGLRIQMIGDRCFIAAVKPGSDAESKGIRPGDEILAIEGYRPTRENLWRMKLMYYSLQPRERLRLALRKPEGLEGVVEAVSEIRTGKLVIDLAGDHAIEEYYEMLREEMAESALDPHAIVTLGKDRDLIVYRMPAFDLSAGEVDENFGKLRRYKAVILDLRGNGGGGVAALERAAAYILGKDVILAERKGRKKEPPIRSAGPVDKPLEAKLAVLVDSETGSAGEILARAVQIEKRGIVFGDRTSGSVRQSRQFSEQIGFDRVIYFGVSVTNADLIMKDGKSIEGIGVMPDEVIIPSPEDMAAGRDPVLAKAVQSMGFNVTAEETGKWFPKKWRP